MPKACYKRVLEVACFSPNSCVLAQTAGADRIEFCHDYHLGGITPTQDDILKARKLIHIPLHIIIRPRGGKFVYRLEEIELMRRDILFCRKHKINGAVFGILTSDNTIDMELNKELIELCWPMKTTFHRAIDDCENIENAFNDIITLNFDNVLTSGGKQNAEEGAETLKILEQKFGEKINIIPGGGIRSKNVSTLLKKTRSKQVHTSAITGNQNLVDVEEIKKIKEKIDLLSC